MQGLQQFVAFAETAKHGSFAAAARELGSAPSTLAKAVSRLEAALGVKLFHRTTRQVSLTPDGERLFHRCQRVLAEVDDLKAEAAGTRTAPAGALRISLPIVYGKRVLMPLLARLVERHPGLQLDIRLEDGYVDLVRDGFDLAVRVGALRDSTLVARRFASQTLLLVGSPDYLERHGTPRSIEALSGHAATVFCQPSDRRLRPWQLRARGKPIELHPPARVRVNDGEGMVEAVCLGLGLGQLPNYMVEDQIADGRLVELLPSCRPPPQAISAVYPSGRLVPPRVRVVLERLDELRAT
ncbi:MAG TPA: LysR family transcriptional regulator [Ideonella sp.]|nr:LysR family transcriptional regulator [Ideonella sp.]